MDDMIQKVVNQLKKNYRAVAGKSITLTAEGDGAKVDVEYVSRYRTLVHAVRSYKIGGLSEVVAARSSWSRVVLASVQRTTPDLKMLNVLSVKQTTETSRNPKIG